jgi:hypothetical protein
MTDVASALFQQFRESLMTSVDGRRMTRPYKMADGKDDFFGLGFTTYPVAGPGSVSYGGGAAVWRVKVPSQLLTVIVLTKLQGALPESFIKDIVGLYSPRRVCANPR